MNLRQLRADVGTVCSTAGWNAWDYAPDDPQALPAAVVGGILEMERLNRIVTRIKLGVTFYVSLADPKDATERLDLALSVGDPDSFIDNLDSVEIADGPAWRSIRFDSAGPYQRVKMPGDSVALACQIVLELTA